DAEEREWRPIPELRLPVRPQRRDEGAAPGHIPELTLQKARRPRGLLEAVARRPQQNDAVRPPDESRIVDKSLLHDESAHAMGDQDQRVVRRQGGLREI